MTKILLLLTSLSAFLFAGFGNAQSTDSGSARGETAPKLTWLTDMDESKSLAAKTGKLILVNFTGSDWCPPCVQLKRDILSTDEFAAYAAENLVLLELDYPRQKPQSEDLKRKNQQLAVAFDIAGFPTLMLLNPEAEEIKRSVGYMPGGPEKFIAWAEEARKK